MFLTDQTNINTTTQIRQWRTQNWQIGWHYTCMCS